LREYVADGSESAFRTLVDRHAGMVHGAALRILRDPSMAEEVAHAVFILLARKARTLPAQCRLAGWLYQTTRFVALAALRSERRRQHYERDLASMNDAANNATEAAADWEQLRPQLDDSLAQLGAPDRDAIVLRFLEGRSFAEVGVAMQTTEAAAKMRVGRALEKLRRALQSQGVRLTAAALGAALATSGVCAAPSSLALQIGTAALASAPDPNRLLLVQEALKIMALKKLKTAVMAGALALLLAGGGAFYVHHHLRPAPSSTAGATVPPVKTFAPLAGDWEGSYESRTSAQAGGVRQRVRLAIRTTDQGRGCAIEMGVLDRNDDIATSFQFTHQLNDQGDRILTTDDPRIGNVSLDGTVTESWHDPKSGDWHAGFRAERVDAGVTTCRWVRQGDRLTIHREDQTLTADGSQIVRSDLSLQRRKPPGQ
jgi:RNA polymerase sigma factor (sigma-70 family)